MSTSGAAKELRSIKAGQLDVHTSPLARSFRHRGVLLVPQLPHTVPVPAPAPGADWSGLSTALRPGVVGCRLLECQRGEAAPLRVC